MTTSTPKRRRKPWKAVRRWTSWLIVVGFVVYLVVACTTRMDADSPGPTEGIKIHASQILEQGWGFNVSKPQPLQVGGSVSGSAGRFTANTWVSLFSAGSQVNGNIEPASAVRLGIANNGTNYIIVVPTTMVKFHLDAPSASKAYATFTVDDHVQATVSPHWQHVGNWWLLSPHSGSMVTPGVNAIPGWNGATGINNKGLGAYLQRHLVVVSLHLTPKQYKAYLG